MPQADADAIGAGDFVGEIQGRSTEESLDVSSAHEFSIVSWMLDQDDVHPWKIAWVDVPEVTDEMR